jgi:Flp pilus assembly pilin Flp
MRTRWKHFWTHSIGQDRIEYALLAVFVLLMAIPSLAAIEQGVNGVFSNITTQAQTIP